MFKDIEFKKALQELPEKEKDKLIFRLLRRDMDLAEKLHFELVDTDSIEDKRRNMETIISNDIKRFSENFHSLDYIAIEMRRISGKISHHVKITKDKFIEQSQKYDLNLDQEFFNYCSYKEDIIDSNLFFELVDSINMKP